MEALVQAAWRSSPATRVALVVARILAALVLAAVALSTTGPLLVLLAVMCWRAEPRPSIPFYDVAQWARANRFALQCREGWFVLAAAVGSVALDYLFSTSFGGEPGQSVGERMGQDALQATLPSLVLIGLYLAVVRRAGGWATIDPFARTISWRRWPYTRGVAPERAWSFSDIRAVDARLTAFGAVVRIDVGDRVLRVRVPTREAEVVATSLTRLVQRDPTPPGPPTPATSGSPA